MSDHSDELVYARLVNNGDIIYRNGLHYIAHVAGSIVGWIPAYSTFPEYSTYKNIPTIFYGKYYPIECPDYPVDKLSERQLIILVNMIKE